jgi:hypothetical protein
MKKNLLLILSFLTISVSNYAQVSIPNGNFENWTTATYEEPTYYPMNSNREAFFRCQAPFNVTKSTNAYHGNYALQLTTEVATDTCFGFIADPTGGGDPSTWTGGMAFNQKPAGIRGYYKYNVPAGDSAGILVVCRLGGSNIGMYMYKLGGLHSSYTLFNETFAPALPATPDSIIIAIVSSNVFANVAFAGSSLTLDSLSFTGVTAQPAQMNGDFELWQTQNIDLPNLWNINSDHGDGVFRTTDRVAGSYALEMQTFPGDNNGVPRANAGGVTNGHWNNSCNCQTGGFPFSNMVDTLAFYYKYVPTHPNDSAPIYLNFRSGGNPTFMEAINLHPSPTYQYVEYPFNLFSAPDTVIITAQSSNWADSALSYIGADLKIDEMHFKSQPLATGMFDKMRSNDVNFYPNPFKTTGIIQISPDMNTSGMEVIIYDALGNTIKDLKTTEHKIYIDRNDIKNGIYFYELRNGGGIIKSGKIVIE